MRDDDRSDELGSLAQSARRTSLKSARTILIVVGVLTTLGHTALFALAETRVDAEIEQERRKAGPGMLLPEAQIKEIRDSLVRIARLVSGFFILVGVLFIVLGICVYRIPVAATVLGLVIYLAGWLGEVVLVSMNGEPGEAAQALFRGIIIKIIIIVALVKAIQAAIAYQNEEKELRRARLDADDLRSSTDDDEYDYKSIR